KPYSACIISLKGKGFYLFKNNEKRFNQFWEDLKYHSSNKNYNIPSNREERIYFLMKKLLTSFHYNKIEDLIEELYVSRSTLQNDLKYIRKILDKYNIILDQRPHYGIKINGDEEQIRYCISEYLFNQPFTLRENMNSWLNILSENRLEIIKNSVLFHLRKHKIFVSDISLQNLITHISIACKRIQENNTVRIDQPHLQEIEEKKEFLVAKEITNYIQKRIKINFTNYEIAYLAIHLQGTKLEKTSFTKKDMTPVVEEYLYKIVQKMLQRIESEYSIKLIDDAELLQAISLHLKPALNRHKFNMNIRNPMLDEIKTKYTFSFNAALVGAQVLFEEMNISINEHEIGYLALHIELAQERKKKESKQIHKCLILCASGLGSAQLLMHKLKNVFGEQLNIMGTIEYYNLQWQTLSNIDFIISTIPIEDNLSVPVVQVNTILGETDLTTISELVDKNKTKIAEYLKKEHTHLNKDIDTREKVIKFICEKLEKSGLVKENYIHSVMQRESYSSTNFGNMVALPHPIEAQTKDTFWSIMTLKKPIKWGESYV